jgi:hypothetical protein
MVVAAYDNGLVCRGRFAVFDMRALTTAPISKVAVAHAPSLSPKRPDRWIIAVVRCRVVERNRRADTTSQCTDQVIPVRL